MTAPRSDATRAAAGIATRDARNAAATVAELGWDAIRDYVDERHHQTVARKLLAVALTDMRSNASTGTLCRMYFDLSEGSLVETARPEAIDWREARR